MLTPQATLAVSEARPALPTPAVEFIPAPEKPEGSSKGKFAQGQESGKEPERKANQAEKRSNPLLDVLAAHNSELSVSLDPATKKIVVKIVNSETKEVIRQIPSKELLDLAAHLTEISGALLDEVI